MLLRVSDFLSLAAHLETGTSEYAMYCLFTSMHPMSTTMMHSHPTAAVGSDKPLREYTARGRISCIPAKVLRCKTSIAPCNRVRTRA